MTSDSVDHASIAENMKCGPLPTRKRGAQSAKAKEEYERALSEWCRRLFRPPRRWISRSAHATGVTS